MLKIHITKEVREQIVDLFGPEIADWWIREYEARARRELAEALEEMEEVSKINFNAALRPLDGLGQCTVMMGRKLEAWLATYCKGYQYDEGFIKRLIADNQHLCFTPGYLKKAMIVVPGSVPKGGLN